jgi:hypothetical protein
MASLLLGGIFLVGCAVYTPRDIRAVEQIIQEAASAGAQKKASYEYYSALEYLRVAKEELAEADDKNAKMFGDIAREKAEKALQKSR